MKLSKAVGIRIDKLLKQRNMTMYQLSKLGGIPRSTICVIIEGKYNTVKLDTIYQIADTLGLTLEEFFKDTLFSNVDD